MFWLLLFLATGGASAVPSGGVARIALGAEPETLHPLLTSMVTAREIGRCLFQRLVTMDRQGNVRPQLLSVLPTVENGGVREDGRVLRLSFRKDVHWHDGRPFTSADLFYTWRAAVEPGLPVTDRIAASHIVAMETPDDWTAVVHFAEPFAPFLVLFPPPIPRHLLEGKDAAAAAAWGRVPVGTGPFAYSDWKAGESLILRGRADGAVAAPRLAQLIFRFVPDANARFVAIRTGEVHIWHSTAEAQAARLRQSKGLRVVEHPVAYWTHLMMNTVRAPLGDPRVREAVARAIDRDALARGIHGGVPEVARGILPPSSWAYDRTGRFPYPYAPRTAERLLDAAGWTRKAKAIRRRGGANLAVRIVFMTGHAQHRREATAIQQMLKRAGIQADLREVAAPQLFGTAGSGGVLATGDFELLLDTWESGEDPASLSNWFGSSAHPPDGLNFARYRSPEVDRLLTSAARTLNWNDRRALYVDAQRKILASLPVLPLFHPVGYTATARSLHGVDPHPTLGLCWNAASWWLEPKNKKK